MISHTTSKLLDRFVLLEKIAASTSPVYRPASWEQWNHAGPNRQFSPPVSYQIIGFLVEEIRVGEPILVLRIQRNDTISIVYFRSSPVMEIRSDGTVETFNSIYQVSYACVQREAKQ